MTGDLSRGFGFLLHDVARLLRKAFDRRAQTLGLTRAQWSVIAHLDRNQGIRQAQLAEILEIEPITLVRLLDRLEQAGWVERRPHPEDRRAHQLFLTPKALPVLERMHALGDALRAEAMAGLSDAERERLIDTLQHIKSNLLALLDPAGDAGAMPEKAGLHRAARNE